MVRYFTQMPHWLKAIVNSLMNRRAQGKQSSEQMVATAAARPTHSNSARNYTPYMQSTTVHHTAANRVKQTPYMPKKNQ
jgi:hypothetical protein